MEVPLKLCNGIYYKFYLKKYIIEPCNNKSISYTDNFKAEKLIKSNEIVSCFKLTHLSPDEIL